MNIKRLEGYDFYDKYGVGRKEISFFDLNKLNEKVKENILKEISEVIDNSDFIDSGANDEFENKFGRWLTSLSYSYPPESYVIGTSSGTSALIVSLKCLNIGQGDEVIVPNNGEASDAGAIVAVGAKPVFCDIDPVTHHLDLEAVKLKMTKNVKVIIAVHMYGNVCDVLKLKQFGIPVIEDCSHAHGAIYNNHSVGLGGENQIGCFSFYPSKTLGAMGDAGAIVTTSQEYADKIRSITRKGQNFKNSFVELHMSARLNAFQAVVLNEKLNHINEYIEKRRSIMKIYDENLPYDIFKQPKSFNRGGCSPHLYVIAPKQSEKYKDRLTISEIGFAVHYPYVLHELNPFCGYYQPLHYMPYDLRVSMEMKDRVISLPLYPEMLMEDVHRVCEVLNG